jgi:transcriptional regulator with XRE-family HTH domain
MAATHGWLVGGGSRDGRVDRRFPRGLKQRESAELSGVDQADISRIECGVLAPTTPTLLRLAEGLNARITLELLPT